MISLNTFCVDLLLLGIVPSLKSDLFSHELPLEKTNFLSSNAYKLVITSGEVMHARVHLSFQL